jgi:cohesin domain-containing protein
VRKKRILAGLIVAAAAVAAASVALYPPQGARNDQGRSAQRAAPQSQSSESRLAALPAREPMGRPRGELFAARSWTPPAPPVSHIATAPAAPVAPPMPYRVAGQLVQGGAIDVVLAKDDRVITVRAGEMVDEQYRVESIGKEGVTLVYVPLGISQVLAMPSLLAIEPASTVARAAPQVAPSAEPSAASGTSAHAAQLRWEGPQTVQAGSEFEVALKLTSAEPVRASPMQVHFDAKLLEPVSVRPGDFFTDGKFSYRINPEGSIFVGGSGHGASANDAEFVVLTFRPIRSGAAELKVSSIVLQGPAGRAIAHEPPASFRTVVQ